MPHERHYSLLDRLIGNVDQALRTLSPGTATARRENPANVQTETELHPQDRRHVAGLMRINHTGEVCAQGLYQGQALTAKFPQVREAMAQAAGEEVDHLVWCEQRLRELDSRTSLLNPAFYLLSFGVGAVAGALGDRWSLGFVAATEDQVCRHLDSHLRQLPPEDQRSRAILQQMRVDESTHATTALAAGGKRFPKPVRELMTGVSQLMTKTTYYL